MTGKVPRTLRARFAVAAFLGVAVCASPAVAERLPLIAVFEHYELTCAPDLAADTPESPDRFLYALGAFRDPALVRRTIEYAMSPAVRTQDRARLLARVLGNPEGRDLAWRMIQARWAELHAGLGAFWWHRAQRRRSRGVLRPAPPAGHRDVLCGASGSTGRTDSRANTGRHRGVRHPR